jgi:VWFA-related protein
MRLTGLRKHRSLGSLPLLLLVFLLAPAARPQNTPTFRSDVANVRIDAQVTAGNKVLRGLGPPDFEVLDEGQRHPLTYAALDLEPIDITLLLDVSGSMREHVREMATVATQALQHLRRGDRVSLMVFAKTAKLKKALTEDLADMPAAISEASEDQTVGSETATNAAIMQAMEYLNASSQRLRRAILILTDNLGENYRLRDEAVIEALLKANILLEGIVIGNKVIVPPRGTRTTKDPEITLPNVFWIASETGGEAIVSSAATQAFPDLVARIRVRYSLQYRAPGGKAGQFRRIEVTLTPAVRMRYPDAIVRARRGYYVREQ